MVGIDAAGNFQCGSGRTLPVWTDNPQSLCSASSSAAPVGGTSGSESDGVASWIKDMFGRN